MDSVDTKNTSLLFSNVRRRRMPGQELVVAAVFIAAALGITGVTLHTYQNPDVEVAARV